MIGCGCSDGQRAALEEARRERDAAEADRDRYHRALVHIAAYGTQDGHLIDGWAEAMRNIAKNTIDPPRSGPVA